MSNKVYDVLKVIAEIVIPAVATIYWIFAEYLGIFPAGETVIGVLIAIDTCLGAILASASANYDEDYELPDPEGDDLGETDGEGAEA